VGSNWIADDTSDRRGISEIGRNRISSKFGKGSHDGPRASHGDQLSAGPNHGHSTAGIVISLVAKYLQSIPVYPVQGSSNRNSIPHGDILTSSPGHRLQAAHVSSWRPVYSVGGGQG